MTIYAICVYNGSGIEGEHLTPLCGVFKDKKTAIEKCNALNKEFAQGTTFETDDEGYMQRTGQTSGATDKWFYWQITETLLR